MIINILMTVMEAQAIVSVAQTLAQASVHIGTYLSQGWQKMVEPAAIALATAMAMGLVELAMELGFKGIGKGLKKAGQAVKKGAGAAASGVKKVAGAGAKGIKSLLKSGAKLASKSGSMIIRNGIIVIKSLQKGFMKGAKKLQGLVDRILQKFKFKKFKLERKGKHIRLYGEVNPWVLLIDGELREIDEKQLKKELKVLEPDGKKPIRLSDAEYSKLEKLDAKELEAIAKKADGDKSKIDFNRVEGTGEVNKINPPKFESTYEERLVQTPVNNGKWTGERGESTFIHENEEVKEILSKAEKEGIDYSEAVPDFSSVSKGNVKIEGMSTDRDVNFKKADELLAKEWGVTPKEVKKWRKQNNYTWHELNDMESMELVPSIINSKFGHLGGVSEVGKAEKKHIRG